MQTVKLSNNSSDSVSANGITHFAADSNADPCKIWRGCPQDYKMTCMNLIANTRDVQEFEPLEQPLLFWKIKLRGTIWMQWLQQGFYGLLHAAF